MAGKSYYNAENKQLLNGFGGETKLGRVSMKQRLEAVQICWFASKYTAIAL
jgi:hypothetical protein